MEKGKRKEITRFTREENSSRLFDLIITCINISLFNHHHGSVNMRLIKSTSILL